MFSNMALSNELSLTDFQARAPSWRRIDPAVYASPFFGKAAYHWDHEVFGFLTGYTDLDDDDHDWRPVRPLGKGGFGIVGLWQKFNNYDTVKDSIAIKQQAYDEDEEFQASMTIGEDGLAMEAAIMQQLNVHGNRNIIRLRDFKNNAAEKLWRFYFEFAPYGDLRVLQSNYRAWSTYFPEDFLWHVFHGLANAALTLHEGPFHGLDGGFIEGPYVLHFDLKPSNIFLSDPVDEEDYDFSNFPTVKMADFGVAKLTSPDDSQNPKDYRGLGTKGYHPPVS